MKYTNLGVYTYNGEDVEYHYSSSATYTEQIGIVDAITSVVVNGDTYMPLLKDVVFNYTLVTMFTDIDDTIFKDKKGNIDIDKFADFDKQTRVSETLKNLIEHGIIVALNDSVDCNIAYKTGMHKDSISTAIVDLIKTVEKKLSAWGDGIDSEKVNKFIENFNKSGLNAKSVVKTYLDTDAYKKNVGSLVGENKELKSKLNEVTAKNVMADKK